MNKKRYVPDIGRLISECEANYARLMKLMPEMETLDRCVLGVSTEEHSGELSIEVIERFKYTLTLRITQQDGAADWLQKPSLTLRLYHDAQMAEVVDNKNMRQLKGTYAYPNQRMFQQDEKGQLNAYLSEWLKHCLDFGHVLNEINFA